MKKVAVIGGGAAGMMAAITAARGNAAVTLYEGNDRVGKKILATGNGKCNFSNLTMDQNCYSGSGKKLLPKLLSIFSEKDAVSFFEQLGMLVKNKNGYLYPMSEQASTVLDLLRQELEMRKVVVSLSDRVKSISRGNSNALWMVEADSGKAEYEAVIIACGGKAAPKTGSDGWGYQLAKQLGHKIIPVVPALVQLRCKNSYIKSLAGVRCDAQMQLLVDGRPIQSERGELQFTEYGISGIPVFQMSARAAGALHKGHTVIVYIDLLPDLEGQKYQAYYRSRIKEKRDYPLEQALCGMANKKLNLMLIREAGFKPGEVLSAVGIHQAEKLFESYKELRADVLAANSFEQAQVCAGGVSGDELSTCLESLYNQGLYFAGEIIDVDGRCGGYNLQWAWSSGYAAGKYAAL